jgi:hypothetical protein
MGYKGQELGEDQEENWYTSYHKIVSEIDFDAQHPQVKEAWRKYFMLKNLIGDNNE